MSGNKIWSPHSLTIIHDVIVTVLLSQFQGFVGKQFIVFACNRPVICKNMTSEMNLPGGPWVFKLIMAIWLGYGTPVDVATSNWNKTAIFSIDWTDYFDKKN